MNVLHKHLQGAHAGLDLGAAGHSRLEQSSGEASETQAQRPGPDPVQGPGPRECGRSPVAATADCENCTHVRAHAASVSAGVEHGTLSHRTPRTPRRGRTRAPAPFCRGPGESNVADPTTGLPHGRGSPAPGPGAEHRGKAQLTPPWAQERAPQNMQPPALGGAWGVRGPHRRANSAAVSGIS